MPRSAQMMLCLKGNLPRMKCTSRNLAVIASFLVLLAACGEIISDEIDDAGKFSYWQEKDDFTGAKGSYLEVKLWIDRPSGEYLDLQFQCFRTSEAQYANEFNLVVNSSVENPQVSGSPRYMDAVLFRRDDQAAQVYRKELSGDVLSTFQAASLNVYPIFDEDEDGNLPKQVRFRFVHGASPLEAELGQVESLSRAPSVDLTVDASDPETEKFLHDCRPKPSQS